MSPQAFTIVRLGWYDTPAQNVSEAFAVTEDGREVRVPSNYFGTISVTAAQHRLGRVEAGHYPMSTWGTAYSMSDFQRGNRSCAFGSEEPWQFKRETSDVVKQLQLAHAYSVQRYEKSGDHKYDLFPIIFDQTPGTLTNLLNLSQTRSRTMCMQHGPNM
ncbi:MAG: hypothetical protein OXC60_19900 [Litoreibacter sp.]|nr:hypothetical protein [Litoreibacter sp.]